MDRRTLSSKTRISILVFFGLILAVGLSSYTDYGISWDEPFQREYGQAVYSYVTGADESMLEGPNRYYGPAFELTLLLFERALGLDDSREIYLMRHLVTFILFFVALVFFYKFCERMFGDWRMGLLGCIFLMISPRIFAHSFYNSKDVPVLALYVIGMFTLLRFLDSRTITSTLVHALVCAVLIDIRIVGGMLPALTVGFAVGSLISTRPGRKEVLRMSGRLAAYLGALVLLVVVFWPTLWRDPVHHFIKAFEEMSHYPLNLPVKYMGEFIWPRDLPWHYTSVWIAITTPVVYTACFLAGVAASIAFLLARVIHKPGGNCGAFPIRMRDLLLLLLWFFFPIVYLPLSSAVVFDEWRHTFFVYPAFIGIGLVGLLTALRGINLHLRGTRGAVLSIVLLAAVGAGVANTARIMVRTHPYQNVYFNTLTGGIRGADGRFDLDYWGLSYREALEYILRADRDPSVSVSVYSRPGRSNAGILPSSERKRLEFVDNPYEATYFATHERWNRLRYPPQDEFFAVRLEGVRIMLVLKESAADSLVTILGK